MADRTECNYQDMQNLSKQLQTEAEAINQLFSQTKGRVEGLHGNQWIGRGSEQFFSEMENSVLPSLARLSGALHMASQIANTIINIYHEAEDEAQNGFKGVSF